MRIYYRCPDADRPTGGVRAIYRHVDILNRHGIEAFVLHRRPGVRCSWFVNATPVASIYAHPLLPTRRLPARLLRRLKRIGRPNPQDELVQLRDEDVIVFPEVRLTDMALYRDNLKVIFNQNAYYTFGSWPAELDAENPYADERLLGVITGSADSAEYLRFAFPTVPIFRVRYSLDPTLFSFTASKKRSLAYMPRKNNDHAEQVLRILRLRGSLEHWEVVPIAELSEAETAARLRQCALFLSFGHPEGFGLPPLEAMQCGAIVVGYHGLGGREYFKPEFTYPIEFGDICEYAATVERLLREFDADGDALASRARAGAEFAASHYAPEAEESDLLKAWEELLTSR